MLVNNAVLMDHPGPTGKLYEDVPLEDWQSMIREQIKQHTPTRRLTTPEDIAAAIVFLGSRANRQITGEVIRITGGRHM